jgi:hypothetical protein
MTNDAKNQKIRFLSAVNAPLEREYMYECICIFENNHNQKFG